MMQLHSANTIQARLCDIWGEVLRRDGVQPESNFFELGGDSLLFQEMLSRVAEVFNTDLSELRPLHYESVRSLACRIDELSNVGARRPSRIPRDIVKGALPASISQEPYLRSNVKPHHFPAFPGRVFAIEGHLDIEIVQRAIKEITRRHASLRTSFSQNRNVAKAESLPWRALRLSLLRLLSEPLFTQQIHTEVPTKITIFDLEHDPPGRKEERKLRIIRLVTETPFDLTVPSNLRISLIKLAATRHLLVVAFPDWAADRISVDNFQREFELLYDAYVKETTPRLPDLPIQYADFASWQCNRLQGPYLSDLIRYWDGEYHSFLPLKPEELPVVEKSLRLYGARPKQNEILYLGLEDSRNLKALAQENKVSLFAVLLTGIYVLLRFYSGRDRFSVSTYLSNRGHRDTQNLIGCFSSFSVLGIDLSADPRLTELFHKVHSKILEVTRYQELSGSALMRFVAKDHQLRQLTHTVHVQFETESPAKGNRPITVRPVDWLPRFSFLLSFFIKEARQNVRIGLVHDEAVFDQSSIDSLICHLRVVLLSMPMGHLVRVSQLVSQIGEGNRQKALVRPT